MDSKNHVKSHGGNPYAMIFRDYMSRMTWLYFLRSKDGAPDVLEQWLADVREYDISKIIRFDDASELRGRKHASNESLPRQIDHNLTV